jgi:hypothetical protein
MRGWALSFEAGFFGMGSLLFIALFNAMFDSA